MVQPCWQNEDDYRYLESADRAGIAWELLRRSADYQAAALGRSAPASIRCGTIELLSETRSALQWGLLFRGDARPPGRRGPAILEPPRACRRAGRGRTPCGRDQKR